MKLDEYQQEALRTAPRPLEAYPRAVRNAVFVLRNTPQTGINRDGVAQQDAEELLKIFDQLIYCLGWAGEVGETLDMVKKHLGHGHPLDLDKLKKEFGDARWYPAVLEDSFGFKSSDVAETNASKLRARYPKGFSVEASRKRIDVQVFPPAEDAPVPPGQVRCDSCGIAKPAVQVDHHSASGINQCLGGCGGGER